MKKGLFKLITILFFSTLTLAQQSPNSPTPVANNEIRDPNSLRMRELQLERIKRDSNKVRLPKTNEELALKFKEIKDDFENIQKLQASIIKVYSTGKTIDYAKIGKLSAEITKRAQKLNGNLFILNPEAEPKIDEKKEERFQGVKDLIVELDKAIGSFVNSPIFTDKKLVDSKISEKTGIDLENIIKLSERLSRETKKFI